MLFFLDQCVPRSIGDYFVQNGHDIILLKDELPVTAPDERVILKAQQLDAFLVSLNGDFADILTYPPKNYGGIIALQVRNRPEAIPKILERLNSYIENNPTKDYYQGKLLLVESHRIRVR